MTDLVVIDGEPYLREDLLFKSDPYECMWWMEMANWVESIYGEQDWR